MGLLQGTWRASSFFSLRVCLESEEPDGRCHPLCGRGYARRPLHGASFRRMGGPGDRRDARLPRRPGPPSRRRGRRPRRPGGPGPSDPSAAHAPAAADHLARLQPDGGHPARRARRLDPALAPAGSRGQGPAPAPERGGAPGVASPRRGPGAAGAGGLPGPGPADRPQAPPRPRPRRDHPDRGTAPLAPPGTPPWTPGEPHAQRAVAVPGRRRTTTATPPAATRRTAVPARIRGQRAGAPAVAGRADAGLALDLAFAPAAEAPALTAGRTLGALPGRPSSISFSRRLSEALYQPPLVAWSNTGWPGLV